MNETFLIDRISAIKLFSDMLDNTSNKRILRIIGAEKMGKSRLLREFKKLMKEKWEGDCALVDLRSKLQGYSDIIFQITQQISTIEYSNYIEVQQKFSPTPKVEIKSLNLLLSAISLNISEPKKDTADEYTRQKIVSAICQDLRSVKPGHPIAILFDTFDEASINIQNWLNEQFLSAMLQIPNVYFVFAGRSLLELPSLWQDICETYILEPVTLDDHLLYCTKLDINISREIIAAFHDAFDGTPGLFAEYASKLKGK